MRAHLGGSSRQSLVIARGKVDAAVKGATVESASALSSELFFIGDTLESNIAIRRAITDPSRDGASKAALLKDLFGKSVGATALTLVTEVSALRWSATKDLVQVLEQLAIEAQASAANIAGELDRVEEEIFTVSRAVATNYELRTALTSSASVAKAALVNELLGKNSSVSTLKLVENWRSRSVESAFSDYEYALAARRDRLIALVRVAAPLSPTQHTRLIDALTKQAGQPVRVNVEVDKSIVGGVSIKYADELVDGSVSHRLAGAGRALAGSN
jgi:F-type H+-transporting ATPase subunit delta